MGREAGTLEGRLGIAVEKSRNTKGGWDLADRGPRSW
jgi:hypothetical protein